MADASGKARAQSWSSKSHCCNRQVVCPQICADCSHQESFPRFSASGHIVHACSHCLCMLTEHSSDGQINNQTNWTLSSSFLSGKNIVRLSMPLLESSQERPVKVIWRNKRTQKINKKKKGAVARKTGGQENASNGESNCFSRLEFKDLVKRSTVIVYALLSSQQRLTSSFSMTKCVFHAIGPHSSRITNIILWQSLGRKWHHR